MSAVKMRTPSCSASVAASRVTAAGRGKQEGRIRGMREDQAAAPPEWPPRASLRQGGRLAGGWGANIRGVREGQKTAAPQAWPPREPLQQEAGWRAGGQHERHLGGNGR